MTKKSIIKFKKELTVVILCGGKGLRLRPITKEIPKPLIKIKQVIAIIAYVLTGQL